MSAWKVILATLVIFVAGLVTGGVAVLKLSLRSEMVPRRYPPILPRPLRVEFVERLDRELDLSPEQHRQVSDIVRQSQERVSGLYEKMGPDLAQELRNTREQIRAVLTPEQNRRYDQMQRRRGPPEGPPHEPQMGEPRFRERRPGIGPPPFERDRNPPPGGTEPGRPLDPDRPINPERPLNQEPPRD